MLDDHRSGGMMRHLTEHHEDAIPCGNASSAGGGQSNAACALVCQWTLNGEPCPSAHVYHTVRTLARHISSRHLGVGRATCEFCEIEFSRKDALRRHQTATCPRHPGYSGGQSGGPLRRTRRRHCKANATRTTQDARV
ncbi:uncharacterized protein C8Q71DRAFT_764711 [Rhodofomes roseus]|uniref:C2H2-type domain-containing protein n=1 Tax=Rhodofomes roseus TaxID=34475 RepID=A0ABQ8KCK1_9APHY|nr:uncharacterized protein C8Q71DRAFT_764711 [Rhodofomes roseus]KAH9835220.1 hypothetical protein C8Q71DRAFT_764711 [Rhodofomes roseus]